MVVQVEFQSLFGGAYCVNGGAAPPPKKPSENLVLGLLKGFSYS